MKELSPLDQAEKEMPLAWYEKFGDHMVNYRVATALAVLSGYAIYKLTCSGTKKSHIIGGTICAISLLSDALSTFRVITAERKAIEAGVDADIYETNVIIKHDKTPTSILKNPKIWLVEGLAMSFSSINLGLGVALALSRQVAVLSNIRLAKRLERATEIAKSRNSSLSNSK